jgi:hypothetical protein
VAGYFTFAVSALTESHTAAQAVSAITQVLSAAGAATSSVAGAEQEANATMNADNKITFFILDCFFN